MLTRKRTIAPAPGTLTFGDRCDACPQSTPLTAHVPTGLTVTMPSVPNEVKAANLTNRWVDGYCRKLAGALHGRAGGAAIIVVDGQVLTAVHNEHCPHAGDPEGPAQVVERLGFDPAEPIAANPNLAPTFLDLVTGGFDPTVRFDLLPGLMRILNADRAHESLKLLVRELDGRYAVESQVAVAQARHQLRLAACECQDARSAIKTV